MAKIIYLVEDDEDIRFIVEYILADAGYNVESFSNVKDFKNRMSTALPDLILLDVMLPDGNGINICRSLKIESSTSHIPIIIMSAHAAEKSVLEEACADDFISKPFDLDFLINRIKLIANE